MSAATSGRQRTETPAPDLATGPAKGRTVGSSGLQGYSENVVIARLDRATQYARASMINRKALKYWVTRFRG
jgi:hypothetical protein